MVGEQGSGEPVQVVFSGSRRELGAILLRGYGLLVPTIGLYRFWLTSWRRRFYWSHTDIGGDRLEYTGNASQLLLGFLMALAVFVPLYGLFFYLSTLSTEAAFVGYGGIGIFIWFLVGYAIYRGRDFRLSRTLWRGIRFDQTGSAWGYAFRRFGWSVLMVFTGGLVYPFMAANLWRYRYRHSWYGDRQFSFAGSWRQLAWPYYTSYVAVLLIGGIGLVAGIGLDVWPGDGAQLNPAGFVPIAISALLCGLVALFYQSREVTRMFSSIELEAARLTVGVSARSLFWIYLLFTLGLTITVCLLLVGGLLVLGAVAGEAFAGGSFDMEAFLGNLRGSFATVAAIIAGYLLILGAFSLNREVFIRLGYWKLVAHGAVISGLDNLGGVQARDEDKALVGEGLADALNVGAY
ncbi:YjgN family protein [Devosia naphthalenivorans]|jgi:hypothetical protein|uniref:YjgN family protein n=1 Tax=Devosia naphthalenivorans TaxID=2082392 RepID=UPI0013B05865|nr:DUF898 family protein [Devosia naphthalenivorans]